MISISVIIPTYKPQSYLWQCLASLQQQTLPAQQFEVILVLNGCCEPYKSEIRRYVSARMRGMNIRFIHTSQSGVSNARNMALDIAVGEYVTFIDDDDFVSPAYLEELYAKASPDTISLCYPYVFRDGDIKQIVHPLTTQYDRASVYGRQEYFKSRKYFSGAWMKLIPKPLIGDVRFDVSFSNGEDCIFMFHISNRFKYVDFTTKQAIYYRRYREDSAVTARRGFCSLLQNGIRMMISYTRIYLSAPLDYKFMFYLTRMLAAVKNIMNWEKHHLVAGECK